VQDLTTGPLTRHLLKTTSFMLVTMVFQTLYFLIDLYWVGRLGTSAVAAVGIAGNSNFIVLALTQMLGVGTTTVVSHAVGSKDKALAHRLFNQSQVLAMTTGAAFTVVGMGVRVWYSRAMSADAVTAALAGDYLLWFIPAMGLQFALVAMGAALRGVGNFKPGMIVGTVTVILNMLLAPVLIFGWGTGHAFGVAGAAISSLIAIVVGIVWFAALFIQKDSFLRFETALWRPDLAAWKRMLAIGLPAGFEFGISAFYIGLVYLAARPFGAAAQAGFGIGQRIIQAGFMPVVALGFAVAPVAGQNFGARLAHRVKHTFRDGALMAIGVMVVFVLAVQLAAEPMLRVFTRDPAVIAVGVEYLRTISWSMIGTGVIFVMSSMFQAMGNTLPSLVTSAVRITLVAIPILVLQRQPGFQLRWIWYLSVGSVITQLGLGLWLLQREYRRRLSFAEAPAVVVAEAAVA